MLATAFINISVSSPEPSALQSSKGIPLETFSISTSLASILTSNEVEEYLHEKILSNNIVLKESLKLALGTLASKGLGLTQSKIAALAHEAIHKIILQGAHSQIRISIGHTITVAACSTTGQLPTKILLKGIATHLSTVITHYMASAMFKKLILVVAKKFILVTITGITIKILATKFGIASAATTLHLMGWIAISRYMATDIYGLNEEMAKKVPRDTITESALDSEKLVTAVVEEVIGFKDWQRVFEEGIDIDDPNFGELEKRTGCLTKSANAFYMDFSHRINKCMIEMQLDWGNREPTGLISVFDSIDAARKRYNYFIAKGFTGVTISSISTTSLRQEILPIRFSNGMVYLPVLRNDSTLFFSTSDAQNYLRVYRRCAMNTEWFALETIPRFMINR
ncbi:hypothetical protein G7Y89_g10623 [Cudoniella acicularis]|uniref:Uncharacterized protein n=1 Tax=Cudoniella acicularis TaxID=354080 RepID=A0A8H4RDX9_9HELO|nr:hypothetical protein G7Y89_g10623 [Cudoniella acicularis]